MQGVDALRAQSRLNSLHNNLITHKDYAADRTETGHFGNYKRRDLITGRGDLLQNVTVTAVIFL